jgi:two-component system, OmpR family, response regulator
MSLNAHILLVDDDKMLSPFIQEYLESKGLTVTLVYSGEDGLHTFRQGQFDLCILDVKMPFKDGFTLAAELRALDAEVPFIFLSSNADKAHRIKGLTLGADDYVPKPFSMEELYLRIAAVLRRVGRQQQQEEVFQETEYTIGRFHFHPQNQELTLDNNIQSLTGIETKLLTLFANAPDGVLERDKALQSIWGDDDYLRGRSLNVYVSKLRQLLKADPNIEIKNMHGTGYRLHIREIG